MFFQNKTFIHFGTNNYNKEDFKKVKNSKYLAMKNKPDGGFWGCEYTPNSEYRSSWEEYVNDIEWDDMILEKFIKFKIIDNARVLVINNEKDLNELEKKYALKSYQFRDFCNHEVLDYEKISKDYDAIYLTEDGFYDNQEKMESWCIESLCVFNPNIVVLDF